MAEGRFWKNWTLEQSPDNPVHPFGSFDFTQMFDVNERSIPGSQNSIFCAWFREPLPEWQVYKPHVHPDAEYIGYFGSNQADVFDLGGEIELWIEDEPYNITRSGVVWLPAGVRHCPWFIRKVTTPIFIIFMHGSNQFEGNYFVDDPRWRHLPATPEDRPEELKFRPKAPAGGFALGPEGAHTAPPLPEIISLEEYYRRQKDNPWVTQP